MELITMRLMFVGFLVSVVVMMGLTLKSMADMNDRRVQKVVKELVR